MKSPARRNRSFMPAPRPLKPRIASLFMLLTIWLSSLACVQSVAGPGGPLILPSSQTRTVAAPASGPLLARSKDPTPTVGESTATQTPTNPPPTATFTPAVTNTPQPPVLYYTQAGDTLRAVAARYAVQVAEITSPATLPDPEALLDPNILLIIPYYLGETSSDQQVIPDSEIVYSPSAIDLDIQQFVRDAGGYLGNSYSEWRAPGQLSGADVIQWVSTENSINPRLLLAILEQQSHWVYGQPANLAEVSYPLGYLKLDNDRKGLYFQLSWAVQQVNIGYYGWRQGRITEIQFPNQSKLRLAPNLNAGTVAVLYLFAQLYNQEEWAGVVYGPDGVMSKYEKMFGSPWMRAQNVEPLFPATLTQPPLELPFMPGRTWSFTGGPHSAWSPDGARAALDFAPMASKPGCYESLEWVASMAGGLVVRSSNGLVMVDLDGDGHEQTGWNIMYLHVSTWNRAKVGTWLNLNDPVGHPSCEGGMATGTHVHIARKYNGEWIQADGPLPFTLSGWRAHAGSDLYLGSLTLGDKTITSSLVGEYFSLVTRP